MIYFLVCAVLSHTKLLWLDELITLHIAQLGSVRAIWQALGQAADPNPPLIHLAVLASIRLFGVHEFALRLPAMVGYWGGMLALYLFLKRRLTPTWALAGTVLSMCTAAFNFSYESRSYGVFYGLAMIAILGWSRAVDPEASSRHRNVALASMTLALAAGICTNYFAVLAFVPIAGGELVRSLQFSKNRPRIKLQPFSELHLRVWLGLLLAVTPLFAFRRLIQSSIALYQPHAWNKVSIDQAFDSYTGMVEAILYPVVAIFVFGALIRVLALFCNKCRQSMHPRWIADLATRQATSGRSSFPRHEAVAVFLLLVYPFAGYVVASIKGGMLAPRLVIPVCFGFAIAATAVTYRIVGHLRYASISALVLCAGLFISHSYSAGFAYYQQKQCFYQVVQGLSRTETDEPIAVPEPLMALTLQHYAPPAIARRVVFPVDFPAIRILRGDDSPEQNLWAGRNYIYKLPIVTVATLQQNAKGYVVVGSNWNWLIQDLEAHHYFVKRVRTNYPDNTIGGFTPLDHGDPSLFIAAGDASVLNDLAPATKPLLQPIPFSATANLPNARVTRPRVRGTGASLVENSDLANTDEAETDEETTDTAKPAR